jgi:colanic acid biosynthesis protein WcaH
MVNVDLLVKNRKNQTLLAWRDDPFAGVGWHLPGGIIRYKEKAETRILKVAEIEIGSVIEFDPVPIAINQVLCNHNTRGHFISLLYNCIIPGDFIPKNQGLINTNAGYLKWHDSCPENLIKVHEMYRNYI